MLVRRASTSAHQAVESLALAHVSPDGAAREGLHRTGRSKGQMNSDERLDRIEKNLEQLTVMVKRMGKYAMVIARVHDDELHAHTRRLLALEEDDV
jgi:hypothetical protein